MNTKRTIRFMKKTIKFLPVIAIALAGLFTACDGGLIEDNPPTISVNSPSADTTDVYIGDSIDFTVSMSSETGLATLSTVTNEGGISLTGGSQTFEGTSAETVTVTATVGSEVADGTVITVTFTVTDEAKQASAQKYIKAVRKDTPLSEAKDFEWKRVGGADGTGLETFGLVWTSNTATNAIIKKGSDKFVELDAATWTSLTSLEAMKAAVDAATDMERWEKVSATQASQTYDYVLATVVSGKYFLIHVTNSTVKVSDVGSTITIAGKYKE